MKIQYKVYEGNQVVLGHIRSIIYDLDRVNITLFQMMQQNYFYKFAKELFLMIRLRKTKVPTLIFFLKKKLYLR